MLDTFMRRAAPLAALALILGGAIVAPVDGQDSSSASAAASASPAPAAATDDDAILAAGRHIWTDAACSNCHGANGQGGSNPDFPKGPNLRTSGLDPDTMLQIVECGLPGTRMPAWLKGAYTEIACYGNPLGPASGDVLMSAAYSEEDIKNLIAYVQVNFMKQPMPDWSAQQ